MSLLPSFQLSVAPVQGIAAGLSTPPSQLCFDLGIPKDTGITGLHNSPQSMGVAGLNDPETPRSPCDGPRSSETPATLKRKGSFNWDWENGWALKWACIVEFEAWLKEEQLTKLIEFVLSSTKPGKWLWAKRWTYVCLCQMSGGHKKYKKKHPDWQCKIDSKKTGCRVRSRSNTIHTRPFSQKRLHIWFPRHVQMVVEVGPPDGWPKECICGPGRSNHEIVFYW